jgi:hypothetical protein
VHIDISVIGVEQPASFSSSPAALFAHLLAPGDNGQRTTDFDVGRWTLSTRHGGAHPRRRRVGRFPLLLLLDRQFHLEPPRAPIACTHFESPGNFVTARSTPAIFHIPFAELVPIALDKQLAATGTPRAAAFAIVHVSGVNVMQPF